MWTFRRNNNIIMVATGQLERFMNDELRVFCCRLWELALKNPQDLEELIVLLTLAILLAITKMILMWTFRIVHITFMTLKWILLIFHNVRLSVVEIAILVALYYSVMVSTEQRYRLMNDEMRDPHELRRRRRVLARMIQVRDVWSTLVVDIGIYVALYLLLRSMLF